jgi:aerobic-type carbon monoxide dehydrogenase small subunit (CoxS/CutS family)
MNVALTVNGEAVTANVEPFTLLLDFVRGRGLTAAKEGCAVGVCGACAMLLDGRPVSACLTFLGCCDGADVWTPEGIARTRPEIVDAFLEHEAFACGACTPGQLVAAAALIDDRRHVDDLRRHLAGNLCRCTGYGPIVAAVESLTRRA